MGGGGTQQTTSTTAPTNPAVDATTTKLLNNLQGQVDKGTAVFGQSLYPGISSQTQQGVNSIYNAAGNTGGLNAANNWAQGAVNSGGYNPALAGAQSGIQQYTDAANANSPLYTAQKRQLIDDVTASTNAAFNASGRYAGGSNVDSLAEGLSSGLISLESDRLNRQLQGNQALAGIAQTAFGNAAGAAGMLPGLYQAGLMPGQAMLSAGQTLDADALARRQGEADLFERQNNNGWNTLGRASSILAGTAGASGQTTTNVSPTAPWWQTGLSLAGQFF